MRATMCPATTKKCLCFLLLFPFPSSKRKTSQSRNWNCNLMAAFLIVLRIPTGCARVACKTAVLNVQDQVIGTRRLTGRPIQLRSRSGSEQPHFQRMRYHFQDQDHHVQSTHKHSPGTPSHQVLSPFKVWMYLSILGFSLRAHSRRLTCRPVRMTSWK